MLRSPLLSGVLPLVTATAHAQSTGRVSGCVLDQTGASLPGVVVDLVASSRELTSSTAAGVYRFEDVPPGRAELTFRLLNFSVLRGSVTVARGASVTADAVLTLSLTADVLVTARQAHFETWPTSRTRRKTWSGLPLLRARGR